MKFLLATLALLASVFGMSATQAQQLPGPAGSGWFVLVGPMPENNKLFKGQCMAVVVSSLEATDGSYRKRIIFLPKNFQPQKKFGPYRSWEMAGDALENSGWSTDNDKFAPWVAASGCEAESSTKEQPPKEQPKTKEFCTNLLKVHGLASRAQFQCGFTKYSKKMMDDAAECLAILGDDEAGKAISWGTTRFDYYKAHDGQNAICNRVLKDFPTIVTK